jgi:GNAT superfamily N-acetyltransferase
VSGNPPALSAPEPLHEHHDLDSFHCGVASLDDWLKRRARANQIGGASRTYIIAAGARAIGYYCLSSGAIAAIEAPGKLRRNMPDPIPVAVLGRLAIDREWQGGGIGVALLQDAVFRAAQAAEIIGIRGVLVHAVSEEARTFYEHHGFIQSPSDSRTLLLSLLNLRR